MSCPTKAPRPLDKSEQVGKVRLLCIFKKRTRKILHIGVDIRESFRSTTYVHVLFVPTEVG